MSTTVLRRSGRIYLAGKVKLTGVHQEFTIDVPVEVQLADGTALRKWIRAGADETDFQIRLPSTPKQVVALPPYSLLCTNSWGTEADVLSWVRPAGIE